MQLRSEIGWNPASSREGEIELLTPSFPALKSQALIGISVFVLGLWLAWNLGGQIVAGDIRSLIFAAMGLAACAAALAVLRSWRTGFSLFLVVLMFEDLPRKYLGNGTALFFGKDVLIGLVYISFLMALRKHNEKLFRPVFLLPLYLFAWLAAAQILNPNSPSILYGLLGFKLYFYYVPLMFLGYALVRGEEDLRKFLVTNAILAAVICVLGIAQAILGNSFLNPANLAPELQDLGDLYKKTPLTNQILSLPDSVFVSAGRYDLFLTLMTILMIGASGYLLLSTQRSRTLIFAVIAIVGGGVLLNGARGTVMYSIASVLVLSAGFLWGAPWRQRQAHRSLKAVGRSLIVAALGLAAVILIFPNEAAPRIAYYTETLLPSSSAYEVGYRTWDYPIANLLETFNQPNWLLGNGTGVCSLSAQYVARFIGQRPPDIGVEDGYGSIALEMGIVAPFLWIVWTAVLLHHSWKVVKRLRGTRFFAIAFSIFWYAFLMLYPFTYTGLAPYQNYVTNAYLWLLIGILFRLPEIQTSTPLQAINPSDVQTDQIAL
jgi:hypothetical protein